MQVVASASSASADVVTTEQPAATPAEKAGLLELNAETFWPHLESAGEDLVVVDFFTDWVRPLAACQPLLSGCLSVILFGLGVHAVAVSAGSGHLSSTYLATLIIANSSNVRSAPVHTTSEPDLHC
jgi:hypothetical protein